MTTTRLIGDPPMEIRLRRSPRARRMTLRVSALDGAVSLTLPRGAPEAEGIAFAEERRAWIEKAQAGASPVAGVTEGAEIPVEGEAVRVAFHDGRGPRLEAGQLWLPMRAPGRCAVAFLKDLARDRLVAACDTHAGTLGVRYKEIALRDTRSRWGSCSMAGRLMFSWRLVMAPPRILDYVAAHEVAHLVHMDHSPAFWGVVAELCPTWKTERRWLRTDGRSLHRIRFED